MQLTHPIEQRQKIEYEDENQDQQLSMIAEYANGQNFPKKVAANASIQKQYENGLRTRVDVQQAFLDTDFESKVLAELKKKDQVKSLLDGISPGVLGLEELVLLLIWTTPLVPPASNGPDSQQLRQAYKKDNYVQ